jgi:hypothetical protein
MLRDTLTYNVGKFVELQLLEQSSLRIHIPITAILHTFAITGYQ